MTDFFTPTVFHEVAALLALAAFVGLLGMLLRQPLIVSFIGTGLLAGPSVFDLVRASGEIDLLSQLGVAVLLFLVGIKLDVRLIRSLGAVALATGLGQVAFTSLIGFIIGLTFGLDAVTSLYVAVALTFSSTIIIVKLLSDKREIDSLHGQVALGFLIVQDLVVVLAMLVLSAFGIGGDGANVAVRLPLALGLGAAQLAIVALLITVVADPLTERLARVPELLVCFAIALAAIFATISDAGGFGKEIGGLLAGVSLASTPYRDAIAARLAPLRDFLLLFFFVALGAGLDLGNLGDQVEPAVAFSLFVLIGNPLIVLAIMGAMGFRKRTGFLAGLTVAQISEFSLIFVAMGVALGHVGSEALGLVTLVGLVTIAASTYMITFSHQLYAWCEPLLGVFEREVTVREPKDASARRADYPVIIFGLGRFGTAIGARLRAKGVPVLGVDFDPSAIRAWQALGLDAEYGDASDAEYVANLPISGARWVVLTVPILPPGVTHDDVVRTTLDAVRAAGFAGRIAITSRREAPADAARHAGVDLVLEPYQDAADRAVELILSAAPPALAIAPGAVMSA